MQKTKLAFVSLLGLLIVLAPVFTTLAKEKQNLKRKNKMPQKDRNKNENLSQNAVFNEIEKQGGKEVSKNKLNKERGEAFWGAVVGGVVGVVVSVWGDMTDGNSDSWGEMAHHSFTSACAGAGVGAISPW